MELFTNIHMCSLLTQTEDITVLRSVPMEKLVHALTLQDSREMMQQNIPLSLTALLAGCHGFKATNPRDMVFALTGITDDPISSLVAPNYKKTVREVFRDVARYILCGKGGENPLFFMSYAGCGHPRLEKDLPSWVPDWTKPVQSLTHGKQFPKYRASGDLSPKFCLNLDIDKIILGGLVVDEVSQLGRNFDEDFIEAKIIKISDGFKVIRWYKSAQNLATECLKAPYVNGQSLSEAFWRAAICDATRDERPASEVYKEYFDCFYKKTLTDEQIENWTKHFETMTPDVPDVPAGLDAQAEEKSTKFTALASKVSAQRRFCITKKGYIGWVPRLSQVGDLVGIIDGEQTPYIVRKCDRGTTHLVAVDSPEIARFLVGCWTPGSTQNIDRATFQEELEYSQFLLLGACYMHAMMDGEMMQAGTPQPFILQ